MHKKNALVVVQTMSNVMGKMLYANRDSVVSNVSGLLFGKSLLIRFYTFSIGSGFGLKKAILFASSAGFRVIAGLNSRQLKIIGSISNLKSRLSTTRYSIWSMMLPISIRMVVC
jgi:uncharacterized membrane protein (UPF0136 family)